ncbi:MAG: isobutyryl-CoA mutase, partial [Pseudonocardiales bacterium]|nr:isobutyryl-CoA mutase [Pseudonocardiales bacterium]
DRLSDFHARHKSEAQEAIRRLQDVPTGEGNVFDELMQAARVCSLGQLTDAFFEVGGQYRRNM